MTRRAQAQTFEQALAQLDRQIDAQLASVEPGKSWLAARLTGARFYYGKLCKKHPAAEGKRYSPSGNCVMCARERSLRQGKARVAAKRGEDNE